MAIMIREAIAVSTAILTVCATGQEFEDLAPLTSAAIASAMTEDLSKPVPSSSWYPEAE